MSNILNSINKLSELCAQLQATLVIEDPVVVALREVTTNWTREDAVRVLHDMDTLPDDLTTIRLPLLKHLHVTFGLTKADAQADEQPTRCD
jgi:hypothetical protein